MIDYGREKHETHIHSNPDSKPFSDDEQNYHRDFGASLQTGGFCSPCDRCRTAASMNPKNDYEKGLKAGVSGHKRLNDSSKGLSGQALINSYKNIADSLRNYLSVEISASCQQGKIETWEDYNKRAWSFGYQDGLAWAAKEYQKEITEWREIQRKNAKCII